MPASTRFALSVHILVLLAQNRKVAMTSEAIAASAGANPAFVRRILIALSKAGLTASQLGKGGGSRLAKGPKKISLLDVYRAVERAALIAPPKERPGTSCAVAAKMPDVFGEIASDAEAAFFASLQSVSLRQAVKKLKKASR